MPIVAEVELEALCTRERVELVVFAHNDVTHAPVMHLASRALACVRLAARAPAGAPAALVLATLALYAPVVRFDFAGLDDEGYLLVNPDLRLGLSAPGVRFAFTTTLKSNWHPLTWLSYLLDYELFGLAPGGYHGTNALLHAAAAALLLVALRRLTGAPWPSLYAAGLFALHPLHVESVAWIAERKDVLSGLFAMAVLWSYARHAERPSVGRYVAVAVCFALGLLAKPMLVTLPFVLLLLDYWPLGRLGREGAARSIDPGRLLACVAEKIPLFLLSLASCAVTLAVQEPAMIQGLPASVRLGNAALAYAAYLRKTLWPADLAAMYPHPLESLSFVRASASAGLIALLSLLALRGPGRRPYLAVGWLWYLGMLVPAIGLIQVGRQGLADRYTYLPLVGIFIAASFGATDLARSLRIPPRALGLAALLSLAALSLVSWRQVEFWRDAESMYRRALEVSPHDPWGYYNLGTTLFEQGRIEASLDPLANAVRLDPADPSARINLARSLAALERLEEATLELRTALELQPDDFEGLLNLGNVLARQQRIDEAIPLFERAVALRPDFAAAQLSLALALALRGRDADALAHAARALERAPDNPDARKLVERLQRR